MIHTFARFVSSFFVKKRIIKKADKDTYEYCFELLISEIINTSIILLILFATKKHIAIFTFSVSFLLLRKWAGGYHASTHFRCSAILVITLIFLISGDVLLNRSYKIWFQNLSAVISIQIICLYAPVENDNKPLTEEQKGLYRNISIILSLVFGFVVLTMSLFKSVIVFGLSYGMMVVSISLIIVEIIEYKKRRGGHEKSV